MHLVIPTLHKADCAKSSLLLTSPLARWWLALLTNKQTCSWYEQHNDHTLVFAWCIAPRASLTRMPTALAALLTFPAAIKIANTATVVIACDEKGKNKSVEQNPSV